MVDDTEKPHLQVLDRRGVLSESLLGEHALYRSQILQYDDFAVRMKYWAVFTAIGALFLGFEQKVPAPLILGAVSVFLFWVTAATYKTFQNILILKTETIENYLNGESDEVPRFGVGEAFRLGNGSAVSVRAGEIGRRLFNAELAFVFLPLFCLSLATFLYNATDWLNGLAFLDFLALDRGSTS